ncbi:MAG: hypothetical protein IJ711_10560 [Lachnospiraceae bacterium]|nr:hypothetical protein [Lachnospiraceae bacterium]
MDYNESKSEKEKNKMSNDLKEGFFRFLQGKSKEDPSILTKAAAGECFQLLKKACTNEKNQIYGDMMLYYASGFAGIACLKAALDNAPKLMLSSENASEYMGLYKIETDTGIFYIGEAINEYLISRDNSVWNLAQEGFLKNHKKDTIPDIEQILSKNAKNFGNKEYRIWNNMHDPYTENKMAQTAYESYLKHLAPYKIGAERMPEVFGIVISEIISQSANIFPKELNCLEMVMETVSFYAHMDCK